MLAPTMGTTMNRHSTLDTRQPEAGTRRHSLRIVHHALCIAALVVFTARADGPNAPISVAVEAEVASFGKKANAELGKLHKAIGEAKDEDAKTVAEAAFKARLAEFEKDFAPLKEKAEKIEGEIAGILQKAKQK